MVNIRFKPDMAAIRKTCEARVNARIQTLLHKENKTFSVIVGNKTYKLRYEPLPDQQVKLFVQTDSGSQADISSPRLQLNIGSFLLPEALDLGFTNTGYNPTAENDYTIDVTDSGVSEAEIALIHKKIKEIGLFNLIS